MTTGHHLALADPRVICSYEGLRGVLWVIPYQIYRSYGAVSPSQQSSNLAESVREKHRGGKPVAELIQREEPPKPELFETHCR